MYPRLGIPESADIHTTLNPVCRYNDDRASVSYRQHLVKPLHYFFAPSVRKAELLHQPDL